MFVTGVRVVEFCINDTRNRNTDSVFCQLLGDDRADNSCDCADAVRHTHQYASVARRDVKVIDVEACTQ